MAEMDTNQKGSNDFGGFTRQEHERIVTAHDQRKIDINTTGRHMGQDSWTQGALPVLVDSDPGIDLSEQSIKS